VNVSDIGFLVPRLVECQPQEWLRTWAERYTALDDAEHRALIARSEVFSRDDFIRIGKWKDGATAEGKWRTNVASVAYPIWIQAAQELPRCPIKREDIEAFLTEWSNRKYTDVFPKSGRSIQKRFGLSRATTLMHFLSGGRFPIFDRRVRTAVIRLYGCRVQNTVHWYLDSFCPLFQELAVLCETPNDLRKLDKALFAYGAFRDRLLAE
jgi:hypothetical protein